MAYFWSGSDLKMLLEAIRSILTEYQPVISILDPFQANSPNLMSLIFPRFPKNLHKLTSKRLCWDGMTVGGEVRLRVNSTMQASKQKDGAGASLQQGNKSQA